MPSLSTYTSHAPLIPLFLSFGIEMSLLFLICHQVTCMPACAALRRACCSRSWPWCN
ncbi:hypothetical protein CGRA01v4_00533 [Colletotrichum graminicola]|nr:hypothetical protein CGRA01v4_00533 [Colletotrichum graminicola]